MRCFGERSIQRKKYELPTAESKRCTGQRQGTQRQPNYLGWLIWRDVQSRASTLAGASIIRFRFGKRGTGKRGTGQFEGNFLETRKGTFLGAGAPRFEHPRRRQVEG